MKRYELIIKEQQPTCGGQSPVKAEIRTVTTDDPVAYVQKLEPGAELAVVNDGDVITITTDHNGKEISYEFTED